MNQILLWFRRGRKMAILVVALMAAWSQCRADYEVGHADARLYRYMYGQCVKVPSEDSRCEPCRPVIEGNIRECRVEPVPLVETIEPIGPPINVGIVTRTSKYPLPHNDAEPVIVTFRPLANQPTPTPAVVAKPHPPHPLYRYDESGRPVLLGVQLYRSESGPCVKVPAWVNSPGCHVCNPTIAGNLRECYVKPGAAYREPIGPAVYVGTVTLDAHVLFRALANQPPATPAVVAKPPPVVAKLDDPSKSTPLSSGPPPEPPQISVDPVFGPMCAGPLRPGPCQDVHRFLLIQNVADGIQLQQIGLHPQYGPLCAGPMGPGPCPGR